MNQQKRRSFNVLCALVLSIISGVYACMGAAPVSAQTTDCSDVFTPLSSFVVNGVNANKWAYERAMNETGVPWEMLAAIHYRETSFSHSNPSNGQGIFQFSGGAGGPYPAGPVNDDEFYRQLKFMANKLQDDYVWRGSIPRERRRLQPGETNIVLVKDTLFSYNGRAGVYANQAAQYGYNSSLQPYEGSPYVMNRFDCPRARMGLITKDFGSMDGIDTRYGAFTVFARLRGESYWRSLSSSPFGDGFVRAKSNDPDDPRQWILYNTVKQYIPDSQTLFAWGLQNVPLVTTTNTILDSLETGPTFGRLFHNIGDPTLYFADGGKKYKVVNQQMKQFWGFSGPESFVSSGLWNLPASGGNLTYAVKNSTDPALYMMDGLNSSNQMVLRQYASPDVFHAWEGDDDSYTVLSDDYFDTIDNAIGSSLTGYTIKGSGPAQYHVIAGQKLHLSSGMAAIFNQSFQAVSDHTLGRLTTSAPVTNFVRMPGNGVTIYMVDNGRKFPVSSPDVLKAWSSDASPNVNILNQGFLNLLVNGGDTVDGYAADAAGQLYIMDGRKIAVPANLDDMYRTGSIFSASAALMNSYGNGGNATVFLKGSGHEIYLMDQGVRRHIPSARDWQLWNGSRGEALTTVSQSVLSQFDQGGQAKYYFGTGGTNYVIDNGTYHSVAAGVAADWLLNSPSAISATTRDYFTAGAALTQKAKVGANYYRVKYGKTHTTTNATVADIWGVSSSPTSVSAQLVATLPASSELSIFARSTDGNDHRIFLVDNAGTDFYHLTSLEQFQSYGYGGGDFIVAVQPSDLGTPGVAKNIIKTATTDSERVIDGGQKHPFSGNAIRDRWVNGSNTLTVSSALWSYFSVGDAVTGNVKGSAPNVYNVDGGQKRWILSQGTYQSNASQYGAFTTVTDKLLTLMPNGSNLP